MEQVGLVLRGGSGGEVVLMDELFLSVARARVCFTPQSDDQPRSSLET